MSTERTTPRARIAIIDDDPETLDTAAGLLGQAGFEVVVYSTNHGRLSFIVRTRPDLVLLDVNMPLVPGDDVCRLMKEHPELRRIPVVYFSSNDEGTLRAMARETEAAGYICKSEMAFDLGGQVARLLAAATSRSV
jgi:DNA-binding response OmpR family regulator